MGKVKAVAAEYDGSLTKTIRLRSIKPVFTEMVIREDAPAYLETTRYTSSQQIFELFTDLQYESKEHFDGKRLRPFSGRSAFFML